MVELASVCELAQEEWLENESKLEKEASWLLPQKEYGLLLLPLRLLWRSLLVQQLAQLPWLLLLPPLLWWSLLVARLALLHFDSQSATTKAESTLDSVVFPNSSYLSLTGLRSCVIDKS